MSGNIREESVASSEVTGGVQGALRSAAATVGDSLSSVSNAITSRAGRSGGHSQFTEGRTIYVGNLSFDTKDADLEAEFSRFGSITSARLAADPTGQLRGFGFVEFSTPEEANKAIEGADQRQFLGRRMNVQLHVPKIRPGQVGGNRGRAAPSLGPSKTLFIGNMPFQMSDKDLNGEDSLCISLLRSHFLTDILHDRSLP
jgi:RNA recognition motif-containing protein